MIFFDAAGKYGKNDPSAAEREFVCNCVFVAVSFADCSACQSDQGPAIQIDWTIWKTAEPMTTKMKRASSSVETG